MDKYIVSAAIKCSDGKTHRLSYDLVRQTEGSVHEFGRVFAEIEKRFPDVYFWIQLYPKDFKGESDNETFDLDTMQMIDIHGNRDNIFPSKQNTENKL